MSTDDVAPPSWEAFFADAARENDRAARAAAKANAPADPRLYARKQAPREFGLPERLACTCGKEVSARYECAQCLELFRQRCATHAIFAWDVTEFLARASQLGTGREGHTRCFYCGPDCYIAGWAAHRPNHAASEAPPSRNDARTHIFEAAKGNGALWDNTDLRRREFAVCVPEEVSAPAGEA